MFNQNRKYTAIYCCPQTPVKSISCVSAASYELPNIGLGYVIKCCFVLDIHMLLVSFDNLYLLHLTALIDV